MITMYEAPIELVRMQNDMAMNIHRKLAEERETYIMQSIEKVGVNVNKDELIKALAYDRGQYEKGYKDGFEAFAKRFEEELGEEFIRDYPYVASAIDNLIDDVETTIFTKVDHNSLCETETYKGELK